VIIATGPGVTVTFVVYGADTHPLESVTITVYMPVESATILCVVSPVFHVYDEPLFAVSVTESPWQNVVGPSGVTEAAVGACSVTVNDAVDVQMPLLMVTEYVPDAFTVMSCVTAPVDHSQMVPALAWSTTESPLQNAAGPVIVACGDGRTVTVTALFAELHPFESVIITEYVPDESTVMLCVVSPVDHVYVAPLLALSITESPSQKIVGPSGVIVTSTGACSVTVMVAEEVHCPLLTVTE
jgi:hypothetical protein